jgi:beta-glucosidase
MSKPEIEMSVEDFLFIPDTLEARCTVKMKAKQAYSIKVIAKSRRQLNIDEPTPHSARLCFLEEFSDDHNIEAAAQLAAKSTIAIVTAGRHAEWESEGSDLENIILPGKQDELIKAVAKASRKTVVVLYGGNPFDVREWIDDVEAVIFANYPGQENGTALADVLSGVVNPSGKLPMSWPHKIEDVPTFGNFPAAMGESGPEIKYEEGLKVGYRHYWKQGAQSSARWDFGFGMSYTQFSFEGLKFEISRQEGEDTIIEVEVTVRNNGAVAGAEVVQVYVEDVEASVWRPWKELKAFDKVFLQPGESKAVKSRMLEKYALSFWEETSNQWVAEKGEFRIHVGELSAPLTLQEGFTWGGL